MSLLDRLNDITPLDLSTYVPLFIEDVQVGLMTTEFRDYLADYPTVFDIRLDGVWVSEELTDFTSRTTAVAAVLDDLRSQGLIPGWRGELYPVGLNFEDDSLFNMERAAATLFGIRTYGVNLHGFVKIEAGRIINGSGLSLWIARRATTKETNPGKLDIVVGGGQPVGISLFDNLMKECGEEAGIPITIAQRALLVSETLFCTERVEGIRHDRHFNYDLELPADFIPTNTDGEVSEFKLMKTDEIMEILSTTDDFAFDSALAIIDFLIRHGVISKNHPEYAALTTNQSYRKIIKGMKVHG